MSVVAVVLEEGPRESIWGKLSRGTHGVPLPLSRLAVGGGVSWGAGGWSNAGRPLYMHNGLHFEARQN